jgi:hypothetical protein
MITLFVDKYSNIFYLREFHTASNACAKADFNFDCLFDLIEYLYSLTEKYGHFLTLYESDYTTGPFRITTTWTLGQYIEINLKILYVSDNKTENNKETKKDEWIDDKIGKMTLDTKEDGIKPKNGDGEEPKDDDSDDTLTGL